ncbi:tripartite tricarboxylate transporter substrate binding protein [Leucobacter albus]|uniref:Tripartite tricarboxylate transporter substrate binding protein n=1 Tax=Leucobacter albus TaxID=272210 RepID=A0ABW3TRH9_9MICO
MEEPASAAPPRTPPKRSRLVSRVVAGAVAACAIGVAAFGSISSASAGGDITSSLTIVAPAAAGGGWDTVAREMQQAQRANGLTANVQVVNMPGAGGTIALGNLTRMEGRANTMLVGGTGLLAATIQYDSAATLDDVTPLAVLFDEYDVLVVPADSPYETLDDLVAAWQADPKSVPWTGGGSFDQLVVTDLALAAGIDPIDTTYISSDGGGEAVAALLNGTAQAAAGGYPDNIDQIESGRLRALALIAEEPVDGIDIPTAREQGYDVTLANWRMLAAPAAITEEETAQLTALIEDSVATPEWQAAVGRYHWSEHFIVGANVAEFLTTERDRIARLYEEMGQ